MAPNIEDRTDAPGLQPETSAVRASAGEEHHKESLLKEPMEGLPGYFEPPLEVRKDRLPSQDW